VLLVVYVRECLPREFVGCCIPIHWVVGIGFCIHTRHGGGRPTYIYMVRTAWTHLTVHEYKIRLIVRLFMTALTTLLPHLVL